MLNLTGFASALTGSAIMTTLLSSRLHYISQVVISFAFSGFVLPILLRSCHIYYGWMIENRIYGVDVSFKDSGMVLITSIAGSTAGIIGCAFLGRRKLLANDLDPGSIGPTAPGTTFCGYFLIYMGFIFLALPSPIIEEMQSSTDFDLALIVNAIISIAIGILTVITLHFMCYEIKITYWVVLKFLQGALACFITVSAAYDLYSISMCIIVSLIGAFIFFFTSEFFFTTTTEDNCNIISIHFFCGILSCCLPPLFSRKANLGFFENPSVYMNMIHLLWQVLCCLATIAVVCIVFTITFILLLIFGLLRHKKEKLAHERAIQLTKETPRPESDIKIDYILSRIDPNKLETFKNPETLKENDNNKTQKVFVNAVNVTKTPFNSVGSNKNKVKVRKGYEAIKKSSKLRMNFQKCKNIVVKNPFHNDFSLK